MPAALVIQLIAQVGWPAAQFLISKWSTRDQPWTAADTARVNAIVNVPASDFEAGIQPLPTA